MNKLISILILSVALGGCSIHHRRVTAPRKFKVSKRCRLIKVTGTKNVVVVIRRNCLVNGLTTAMVVVTNTKKTQRKKVVEEGTKLLIHALGFVPQLSLLVMGKVPLKGRPDGVMYLFAVVGAKEYLSVDMQTGRKKYLK